MTQGRKIVGFWTGKNEQATGDEPRAVDAADPGEHVTAPMPEPALPARSSDTADAPDHGLVPPESPDAPAGRPAWLAWLMLALSASWVSFTLLLASNGLRQLPPPDQLPLWLLTALLPVVALGVLVIAAMLASPTVSRRFGTAAGQLRAEQQAMLARSADIAAQLVAAQSALAAQQDALTAMARQANDRLGSKTTALAATMASIAASSERTDQASGATLARLDALLAAMPRLEDVAQRLDAAFRDSGKLAHQRGSELEAQIAGLTGQMVAAGDLSAQTSAKIHSDIDQMTLAVRDLLARLSHQSAALVSDNAVQLAAVDAARATLAQQLETMGDSLRGLTDQAARRMADCARDCDAMFNEQLAAIASSSNQVGDQINAHKDSAQQLTGALNESALHIARDFGLMREAAENDVQQVTAMLQQAIDKAAAFAAGVDDSRSRSAAMMQDHDAMLAAIDALMREIEETVPNGFARLEQDSARARELLFGIGEPLAQQTAQARTLLADICAVRDEVDAAQAALVNATTLNADMLQDAAVAIQHLCAQAEAAQQRLVDLDTAAARTTAAAQDRLRQFGAEASALLSEELAEQSEQIGAGVAENVQRVIAGSLDSAARAGLDQLVQASQDAVAAAQQAADQLVRQTISVNETIAEMEQRVTAGRATAETSERETLARQMAVLVDALNSTAIDVGKALSSDVGDTAWDAYLKGDRSIFTRRAVRLADNGTVKQIARRYADDSGFQDHVNRYIHDFEAMLRAVLATRDGSTISVTLLSSDIGKLYVMLAQAIDRLRS